MQNTKIKNFCKNDVELTVKIKNRIKNFKKNILAASNYYCCDQLVYEKCSPLGVNCGCDCANTGIDCQTLNCICPTSPGDCGC
jgi:hypothetical protein